MLNNKDNNKSKNWNSQDLIKLSQSLGEAFLPGLDNGKSSEEDDSLTMGKFLEINRNKDRARK